MRSFASLVPLLFATPSPPTTDLTPASKLVSDIKGLLNDLDTAPLSRHYSPTLKFSFVNPPNATASSTWRDHDKHQLPTFEADPKSTFEQIAATHNSTKPIAVLLPGLDGFGISATEQFNDMAENFEFWRMSVSVNDKSSFTSMTDAVVKFIDDIAVKHGREVVLIGESYGGLLAPSVAIRYKIRQESPIKGLVLVNPATSFDKTQWTTLGPLLASLRYLENKENEPARRFPTPYSVLGGLTLSALIPDSNQFGRILDTLSGLPVQNTDDLAQIFKTMGNGFDLLAELLPADILEHRLTRLLPAGSAVVNPRISSLDLPTVIISGQEDNLLPTKEEAERLSKEFPNNNLIRVSGSGHWVLDDRLNLTEIIVDSQIDPFKKRLEKPIDPITGWKKPSEEYTRHTIENSVKPLRRLTSPVFFSTDKEGKRRKGLSELPTQNEGPLLFVANHQFGGLDLGMIIAELVEERDLWVRGLAHPIAMGVAGAINGGEQVASRRTIRTDGNGDNNNFFSTDRFKDFGAVVVTPRNYYRLMQTGQNALLFPGGVKEVFHGKDEAYKLIWPENVDFVRTAARFNATIVPISALGAADSVNILIDGPEILKLPFGIGERAANSSANIVSARFNQNNTDELFQPPFALPKGLPARHYFVFGEAISTDHIDPKDKDGCAKLYKAVQDEMNRGFDDVLHARKEDPFADTARRIAYEQLAGRAAPTFPVELLNRKKVNTT
mmetsp:Transcript_3776/g.5834  ORF Transcript_3776/g.5834 Transcript_3776/m.5834 type:complete len:725 (-) Transcript_3776:374-2548(-)